VQDPTPDRRPSTSEAIRVDLPLADFTGIEPGDEVQLAGTVREVVEEDIACCPVTRLRGTTVTVLSRDNELPPPIVVGEGGRVPPSEVIDDDGNSECNPTVDGLDFWESLEHMRIQVDQPRVIGASKAGDVVVVGDDGRQATGLSARGALTIGSEDFNPERIFLDPLQQNLPRLWVGDRLAGSVLGVVTPVDDHWELMATTSLEPVASHPAPMIAPPAAAGTLSVASFNVKNLNVTQDPERFLDLGRIIVDSLAAPDLIALQEIQDDNGPGDGDPNLGGGTKLVSARLTLDTLVGAIDAVGGPEYTWHQIDPKYGNDGGAILSNIRTAFLVRSDGALSFVSRPGADAETTVGIETPEPGAGTSPRLTHSPGRIDPGNPAFHTSRKPLVAELRWGERTLFAINVHYNARLADDPLFCCRQPPELHSQARRVEQAKVVNGFVRRLLAVDPAALIVVLGDFNTFDFEPGVTETMGSELMNLATTLPREERYSYIYQGNAQLIDHVLVSDALHDASLRASDPFQVIHVNAEQPAVVQASDHDPLLARFDPAGATPPPAPSATPRPTPPNITVRGRILLPYTAAGHDLGRVAPTATPRPTQRPTATVPAPPSPTVTPIARRQGPFVAYLECAGRDELVLLRHGGGPAVDIDGWTLVSVVGDQRLVFDDGQLEDTRMRSGEELEIHSGPDAPPDGPGVLRWRRSYVWTDDDAAELRNAAGELVNRLACGEEIVEP
jgi:endonuclease/exonuclease/phosphatase family metal-dependent hydrolase